MAIRVVPYAQLKLLLIHIYIVKVEVAALHKVSEDFLNHRKSDWVAFDPEVLSEVQVGEVKTRSQKLPLIKYW